MDEWVGLDRVISPPSIAAVEVKLQSEAKLREKREAELRANPALASELGLDTGAAGEGKDLGIRTRRQKADDGEEPEVQMMLRRNLILFSQSVCACAASIWVE